MEKCHIWCWAGVSVLLLYVAAMFTPATAQAAGTSTSYGTDFYIGFMQNLGGFSFGQLRLTVGTVSENSVSFVVENHAGIIHTGTVTPNVPVTVQISNDLQVLNSDFINREKGIHVYSTDGGQLYVVAENFISFLNHGAYLAYPCQSLGENIDEYQYGVVSVDDPTDVQDSQVLLIACDNDTVVTITPSQSIALPTDTQAASSSITVEAGVLSHELTLSEMQTLLVSSIDDLTGSVIMSNKPLVVISGHECANIPLSEAGCEPLAVQVPPIATWGTQFLLAPFAGRDGPQAFKAVSSKPNTTFIYTCDSESRFAPETDILSFFSAAYCYLQSTEPVFIVQLSFGGSIDSRGDPAVSMVSPIDQYVNSVDFVSLSSSSFSSNYISVTVAAEHYNLNYSILLDGQPIDCVWEEIHDSEEEVMGYGCDKVVSSNRNAPRKHSVSHSEENGLLSVLVYGFNSFPGLGYSYLAGQFLQLTEVDGEDIDFEVNFLPILDLTTFPKFTELDKSQPDSTSESITIPDGLIFGDKIATLAYVNENGVISFNKPWKFSVPDRFPTHYFWTRAGMAVAPFWSDNDIRKEGDVRFVTYHSSEAASNPAGANWLQQVNQYIQSIQGEEEEAFEGNWLLTAHWDHVHPSPHGEDDHRGISEEELEQVNSYQTTIVTNVITTYVVFSYMCGEVQWSSLGRNRAAVVGYNSEGSFFDNHRLSGLSGVGDAVSCTFDIGKRRKRQNMTPNNMPMQLPNDPVIQQAVQDCIMTASLDRLVIPDDPADDPHSGPRALADLLDPCPCSLDQVVVDRARFMSMPNNCYVSSKPVNHLVPALGQVSLTQMCCYSDDGALQTSTASGEQASTMLLYHPVLNTKRYMQTEVSFRRACCEIGFDDNYYCGKFFERRIINNCEGYKPPVQGDPHYRTFDSKYFDFQGVGQYVLLKILPEQGDPDGSLFTLQGRTTPWKYNQQVSVHAELAFGRQGLSFHIERGFKLYQTQPQVMDIAGQLSTVGQTLKINNSVQLRRISSTTLLVLFIESEIILEIDDRNSHLNFRVYAPSKYQGRTQGFLGNYDGDANNEFHSRANVIFPNANLATDKDIFPWLQNDWAFNKDVDEQNFFRPVNRRKRQDEEPTSVTPLFFEDIVVTDELSMMCEGNPQCILDLFATGDPGLAMETLDHEKETNLTEATIMNFPPNISADDVFSFTIGEESSYTILVVDPGDEFTLTVLRGLPLNSELDDLGGGEYVFRWSPLEVTHEPLTFVANDSRGASTTYTPTVEICGCVNGGNCTRDGLLSSNATVVLNCVCGEAFSGTFCEEDRNGCSEIQCFEGVECMDVPAPGVGAVCGSCPDGYTGDASKCYDIDECQANATLCDQICENTDGSFVCLCNDGYELTATNQCKDVNECDRVNDCQQMCMNEEGSYSCGCMDGFTLAEDGRNCTADVPCEGHTCSYECAVIDGEEQCYCPAGFELVMPGGTQCADINECDNSPCSQLCKNTDGSFECECLEGYRLRDDGLTCTDIDECLEAILTELDLCKDDRNSECLNSEGSFACTCVPGYERVNSTCTRIVNEPPPPPPPAVTPTTGAENSINYTAPNLTPETFTPALQQKFRDITAESVNTYCAEVTCTVIVSDADVNEISKLTVEPVNVAIPLSLIGQNEEGELVFTFFVQLSEGFLSRVDLQMAIEPSEEQYREAGFLLPLPTTEVPTTDPPTTEMPIACPPLCTPEYCSGFFTRRSLCTIPNPPATSGCSSSPCRISFCNTCYYADEDRPLPGGCDLCPYSPQVSHADEKCFKQWRVCVRRANGAIYPKERGKGGQTAERFRCYEHPCFEN